MSNKIFTNLTAIFCTVALLFAGYMGAEAQTEEPIFEDELICCIQSGNEYVVAPMQLKQELESHFGQVAVTESLGTLIARLPAATTLNGVRFEGGWPQGMAASNLHGLGYTLQTSTPPTLSSATVAVLLTV